MKNSLLYRLTNCLCACLRQGVDTLVNYFSAANIARGWGNFVYTSTVIDAHTTVYVLSLRFAHRSASFSLIFVTPYSHHVIIPCFEHSFI